MSARAEPSLIIQVPRDSPVERQLKSEPPPSVDREGVLVMAGPTDPEGNLEALAAGEVVLSVASPEALLRAADEVRRVIAHAGTGDAPLVVVIEAAEELREDEVEAVAQSADRAKRPVILRVMRTP